MPRKTNPNQGGEDWATGPLEYEDGSTSRLRASGSAAGESPVAEGQAGQRRLCGEAGKWAGQVASAGHVGRVEGCTLAGARHVGSPRSPAGEENLLACGRWMSSVVRDRDSRVRPVLHIKSPCIYRAIQFKPLTSQTVFILFYLWSLFRYISCT